jgi:hypothetical protein
MHKLTTSMFISFQTKIKKFVEELWEKVDNEAMQKLFLTS